VVIAVVVGKKPKREKISLLSLLSYMENLKTSMILLNSFHSLLALI
jgi:hypothetical protein